MIKDKQYRIVKKYERVGEFEEVQPYYEVQYLGYVFSLLFFPRKLAWKPCKRLVGYGVDVWKENVTYRKLEDAQRYLRGIMTPLHWDEVIATYKQRG